MRITKPLSLFVFMFFALSAFSQIRDSVPLLVADSLKEVVIYADTGKALNRTDAQGRKQGLWEKRYPNGHLRYRGHFKDDKPYGVFKYWWPTDSLQNITYYSEGGKVARSEIFYENGGLLSIGKFVNKQKDSIWIYYDDSHKLIKKEQYALGKKEGKTVLFYDNGNVSEIMNWHNDQENGSWQQFYEDGQTKLEATYLNGKLEGLMRLFDHGENDVPKATGYYHNDNREGKWFYRNGETGKIDTAVYKDDKLIKGGINQFTPKAIDSAKTKSLEKEQDLKNRGINGGTGGRRDEGSGDDGR